MSTDEHWPSPREIRDSFEQPWRVPIEPPRKSGAEQLLDTVGYIRPGLNVMPPIGSISQEVSTEEIHKFLDKKLKPITTYFQLVDSEQLTDQEKKELAKKLLDFARRDLTPYFKNCVMHAEKIKSSKTDSLSRRIEEREFGRDWGSARIDRKASYYDERILQIKVEEQTLEQYIKRLETLSGR